MSENENKQAAKLVGQKELAERLGRTPRTVRRWATKGIIVPIRAGRAVMFDWPETLRRLKGGQE